MPRKAKVLNKSEFLVSKDHVYHCYMCGKKEDDATRKFYMSLYSPSFKYNNKYVPICKDCVNSEFERYEKKYNTRTACVIICYKLDVPFYNSLFDSINNNADSFSIGFYLRAINGTQYRNQTFVQSIVNREVNKSLGEIQDEKEVKWSLEEKKNKNEVINIVGYDPFEGYSNNDRRFLFSELVKYFDDDITEDTYKLSQIIQIVNNNNQIRQYDLLISSLNPKTDAADIETLCNLKKKCVDSNDKIAKENEISVKNRSNKDIGKSTLTYLMKDLREKDFDKAEANYYDQLTSKGTLWAIEMSNKAILQNGMFDENDKQEIFDTQRKLIQDLQSKLDESEEKNRLLLKENETLKGDKNE